MTQHEVAAVSGSTTTIKTLADGTLRVSIDIEPRDAQSAFAMFGSPGTSVALARITPEAAVADMREKATATEEDYGHHYTALYMRGFFHNPRVAQAFGANMDMTPEARTEHIKRYIYVETGSESLKEIPPEYFVAVCGALGVQDAVPASILEAAAGKGI